MGRVIVFEKPQTLSFAREEERPLAPGEVRVKTLYSGISAGTELSAYRGSNPYLHKRWEPATRLFLPSEAPSQPYPLRGWGYEEVGRVIETGAAVRGVQVGEVVYGTWGHRTRHILDEGYAAARILPPGLDPILGIFSHIGPIALNGILDANLHIGENAAVFGLGVPGQIAAQLAARSGARVFGVDPIEARLEMATRLGGVQVALNPRQGSAAEQIKALTGGRGADVAIEVSGSAAALQEATRAVALSARVVALGFFQGEAAGLYLGEEFHHNRIQVVCSQIGQVDPALSYRWDRLRLVHTIMDLQAQGGLNLRPLITHVVPFAEAGAAFRLLDEHPEQALQIVLDCGGEA